MKLINHILYIVLALAASLATWSCDKSDDGPTPPDETVGGGNEQQTYQRTVVVYMVANNNLNSWAKTDIEEMKTGMRSLRADTTKNLLVYFDGTDRKPRLLRINSDGTATEILSYDTSKSSVSIERMSSVIDDVKELYPSINYGLVLWSHGTGWLSDTGAINEPMLASEATADGAIAPLSFGMDGLSSLTAKRMKIISLAKALESTKFEYIYFDCCHMATVEVAYELRHATDIIVGSVTELGVEGMPYDKNVEHLLAGASAMSKAVSETFKFYDDQYNIYGSEDPWGCSITLINATGLDRLAEATRAIFQSAAAPGSEYAGVKCFRQGVMAGGIYDMKDYIHAFAAEKSLTDNWDSAFDEVVKVHYTTEKVYALPAADFHGLGSHIVRTAADIQFCGYDETSWWRDVASYISLP